MASTQTLTELPVIQETGMDYTSVISQIKEIIENNNNWSQNWTEFYNSEAGTLLIQLMAWICDNLAVRQDLIYNENYLATATSSEAKRRLLHQIGYSMRSRKATVIKIALEFKNITEELIPLSNCRSDMSNFSTVKPNIFKFFGKDINGKSIPFEILKVDRDGVPDYTYSIYLRAGDNYYTKDESGYELTALQGSTIYKEFESDTNDGPIFELEEGLDIDSVKVYDISNKNLMHIRVENFTDLRVFNGNIPCYVVEQNENGNYQIRYPNRKLVDNEATGGLFNAGNKICVFYRTCVGSDANIPADYIHASETVDDETGESLEVTITNISSGYYGKDAESLDAAVKDGPLSLVSANRAVTSEDFDRILKKNNLVLKTKTFTPENMPTAFEKYFGRKIMPHEAFSMLILNKQIDEIPDNKLNYFPWTETIKSSVLNEKYSFGDCELNRRITYGVNKYDNCYIKDKVGEVTIPEFSNNGKYYNYSYSYNNDSYYARMLKNALVFSTSNIFQNTIMNEKSSEETDVMKIKVHNTMEDVLYIDDVTNIFGKKENITTKNNILVKDTNASYTSTRAEKAIDCKKYKYLKFVLDDTHTITVDLHQDINLTDVNIIDNHLKGQGNYNKDNAIDFFEHYYLYITNSNVVEDDTDEWKEIAEKLGADSVEEAKKSELGWNSIKTYYNSIKSACMRRGIVELIRDAVKETFDYTTEIDYENDFLNNIETEIETEDLLKKEAQKFYNEQRNGVDKDKLFPKGKINVKEFIKAFCKYIWYDETKKDHYYEINNFTRIYNLSENEITKHYVIQFEEQETGNTSEDKKVVKLAKILNIYGNDTTIDTKPEKQNPQEIMYNSCFADKSIFIDLGLQQKTGNDEKYVYLEQEKGSENYYRIRIGKEIYAIRIDAVAFEKMHKFYTKLSTCNNQEGNFVYSYFPYIGKGDLYYGLNLYEALHEDEDGKVNAYLAKLINKPFSRRKIADESNLGIDEILKTTEATIKFDLETVARMLEYAFSPLNVDKEIIYKFNSVNRKWEDLVAAKLDSDDKAGYVMNGYLRVRDIKKANYPENSVLKLEKERNLYSDGYEKDIRFELINLGKNKDGEIVEDQLDVDSDGEKVFNISSVSGKEIGTELNPDDEDVKLNGKNTQDLIESLLGYRRQYSSGKSDYINNINKVVSYVGEKDYARLVIKSLKKGREGSIYFIKFTENEKESELIYYLGLIDGFVYEYGGYNKNEQYKNVARSRKACGQQRVELVVGDGSDDTSFKVSNGVNVNDIKAVSKKEIDVETLSKENRIISATIGDIIATSSDINYADFSDVYVSYLLTETDRLQIDKQDNFYYTSDLGLNEEAKPPIVGIEGESVYFDNDSECYKIDETKSDFKVKLTVDKVDTNSFYNILEDTLSELKVLPQKQTRIETNVINGSDMYGVGGIKLDGDYKEAVNKQVPLIITIDELTNRVDKSEEFKYNHYKETVLAINPGKTCETTGAYIYNQFNNRIKVHPSDYLKNNCYAFVNKYYNTNDKLIISSVVSNSNTNITFYYPDETAFNSQGDDLNITIKAEGAVEQKLAVEMFYKLLFGTNITNKEFYDLYPKDKMIEVNGSDKIVVYTNPDNKTEYFYMPVPECSLKFIYRTFKDDTKKESKFGDYYITSENNGNGGFKDGYRFFINKTEGSIFPDKGFYLHFVNDRTYEPNRNTEEDVLIEYMKKHQIIGTEFHVLKPYFKTFDIKGVVKFNANYSVSDIRPKVEKALKDKYRITSVKDLNVGNSIYRSDIFKTVLGLEGVEGFELEYFGYDYTNRIKYPDQKYSLNVTNNGENKAGPEFYIMSILATSNGKHGIILEYEPIEKII